MADRKGFLSDASIKRRCAEEFTPKGKKTYALFTNPNFPDRMLQRPKDPASLMEITTRISGTSFEQQVENYIRGLKQIPNQSQDVYILIPDELRLRATNTVRSSRPYVAPVGTATQTTSLRDSSLLPLTFTATPPSGTRAPTPRLPMQVEQSMEPQATVVSRALAYARGRMSAERRAVREALESPTTAARVLTTPADVRILRSRAVPRTPGSSSSQEIVRFPGALSEDIDKDLLA